MGKKPLTLGAHIHITIRCSLCEFDQVFCATVVETLPGGKSQVAYRPSQHVCPRLN